MCLVREARKHVWNPTLNEQESKASQTHSILKSGFGSGGARSFAQKFVSVLNLNIYIYI